MAIDKTIRIQDLPSKTVMEPEFLFVVNDYDNITHKVTYQDFVSGITDFGQI